MGRGTSAIASAGAGRKRTVVEASWGVLAGVLASVRQTACDSCHFVVLLLLSGRSVPSRCSASCAPVSAWRRHCCECEWGLPRRHAAAGPVLQVHGESGLESSCEVMHQKYSKSHMLYRPKSLLYMNKCMSSLEQGMRVKTHV